MRRKSKKPKELLRVEKYVEKPIDQNLKIKDVKFENHGNFVNTVLYYGFPFNQIVSCSDDGTIRLVELENGKCHDILRDHDLNVRHLIKWNNRIFLSAGVDSKIFSYCLELNPPRCTKLKTFEMNSTDVKQILKIDSDLFLSLNNEGELFVISYTQNTVISKLEKQIPYFSNSKLVKSYNFPHCFYMNTDDELKVKLIDYERNSVVREIHKQQKKQVLTISCYLSSEKHEILVFGGMDKLLYFYDMESNHDKKNPEKPKLIKKTKVSGFIYSSLVLNHNYLSVGDYVGTTHFYDLKHPKFRNILKRKIHRKRINDITSFININKDLSINLLTCSSDNSVKWIETTNFRILNDSIKLKEDTPEIKDIYKHTNTKIRRYVESKFSKNERFKDRLRKNKDELWQITDELMGSVISDYFDTSEICDSEEYRIALDFFKDHLDFPSVWGRGCNVLTGLPSHDERFTIGEYSLRTFELEGLGVEYRKEVEQGTPVNDDVAARYNPLYSVSYIGHFKNNVKYGRGMLIHPEDGTVIFEGSFVDGKVEARYVNDIIDDIKKQYTLEFRHKFIKAKFSEFFGVPGGMGGPGHPNRNTSKGIGPEKIKHVMKGLREHLRREMLNLITSLFQVSLPEFLSIDKNNPLLELRDYFVSFIGNISLLETSNSTIYVGETRMSETAKNSKVQDGYGIDMYSRKKVYLVEYVGNFCDGKRHGKGKLFDKKGVRLCYDGGWKDGKKHGRGMEFGLDQKKRNVTVYEGQFKGGVRDGLGEAYDLKGGKVNKGMWVKGKLPKKNAFSYECPMFDFDQIQKKLDVEDFLGSGAFGTVYRLKASAVPALKTSHEYVAIKVMRSNHQMVGNTLFRAVKTGIELCARVKDSKHILKTFGMFRSYPKLGCVMEYAKMSIDQAISASAGSLGIPKKIQFLYETAKGMKELHSQKVMHRDLKWGNVLLSFDDVIKLTDFDSLRESEQWRLVSQKLSSKVGTPGFLAPEVYLGKMYSLSCDVYSFGIMIHSLLFELNNPYVSQYACTCGQVMERIVSSNSLNDHVAKCGFRPFVDPQKIKNVPRYLIDLMLACWSSDPVSRPSFADIVQLFEDEKLRKGCYTIFELHFPRVQKIKVKKKVFCTGDFKTVKTWIEKALGGKNVVVSKMSHARGGVISRGKDVARIVQEFGESSPMLEVEASTIQKMLLVEPRIERLVEYIENKFFGSKVEELTHKIVGNIESDEDVIKIIKQEDRPVLTVQMRYIVVTLNFSVYKDIDNRKIRLARTELRYIEDFIEKEYREYSLKQLIHAKVGEIKSDDDIVKLVAMDDPDELVFEVIFDKKFKRIKPEAKKKYRNGKETIIYGSTNFATSSNLSTLNSSKLSSISTTNSSNSSNLIGENEKLRKTIIEKDEEIQKLKKMLRQHKKDLILAKRKLMLEEKLNEKEEIEGEGPEEEEET